MLKKISYSTLTLQKYLKSVYNTSLHKLVHLLERHHNDNFKAHLDTYFPTWKECRVMLNECVLGFEGWEVK